jgi:cell division cycle 20-like protein 1 (cofactor of APC complex)
MTAWNPHPSLLSTGSRDRYILHRDLRVANTHTTSLLAHRQEVCGLKWSPIVQLLASGGNDNKLLVWDTRLSRSCSCSSSSLSHHNNRNTQTERDRIDSSKGTTPLFCYNQHTAAVKAIAWSPHQRGLLLSGGGTADRTIKLWDTLHTTDPNDTKPLLSIDTGSQVCNLAWCQHVNEIISTHGYSHNQIMLWSYPKLVAPFATLTGHQQRVLYLALSPNNQVIATAAADQTLRFWNLFPEQNGSDSIPNNLSHVTLKLSNCNQIR